MGILAGRARRGWKWALVGVSVLAAVVSVLAAVALGRGGDTTTGDLPPADARIFNLPDGKAQISVTRANERDIVVQRRFSDGSTWSDPEVVYRDDDRMLLDVRIRVGGPTLALSATFTPPDTYYDDESSGAELAADDVTAFVVCRGESCNASSAYDGTGYGAPTVTPDGDHVLLARVNGTYVTWHGKGIDEQRPTGLPAGSSEEDAPLLAPDGSLRVVHGEPAAEGCDFTLLTTDPGRAGFTDAARYQDTTDHRSHCTTTLETFSADYVVVSRSKYDVWFLARTGGTWHQVAEDPSGQVRYPRPGKPKLAGAYERSGFWHWRQVIGSSPDGHTLVVQVHFPGAESWSAPQVVARAPKGCSASTSRPSPRTPGTRRTPSTSTSGAGRGPRPTRLGCTPSRPRSPTTGRPGTASWPRTPACG